MKLLRPVVLIGLFGLSACAAGGYEAPLILDDGALRLVIQTPKPAQSVQEPILLLARIQNVSEHDRFFYTRKSSGVPSFEVTGPDGQEVETMYAIDDPPPPGREDFRLIEAGDSLGSRFQAHLSPDQLLPPGAYTLTAVYQVIEDAYYDPETGREIPMSGWTGTLRSNPLTVELTE